MGCRLSLPLALALALALAPGAGPPARADWLVTRAGDRVETQGPWTVKGATVVFQLANGTLSSLRLSQVDLEASRIATEEALKPPPPPLPAPAKQPVAVITDEDIPRAQVPAVPPEEAAEAATESPETAATTPDGAAPQEQPKAAEPQINPGLVVKTWRQTQDPGADIQILGTVENITGAVVTNLSVTVRLLGSDGEMVGQAEATVIPPAIAAGGTTNFRALFPGVRSFIEARFELRSAASGTLQARPKPAGGESPEA